MTRLATLLSVAGGLLALAAPVPKDHPWVTVRGYVVWPKGQDIPTRKEVNVPAGQDRQACCADGPVLAETLVVNEKNRGVANVVVWLRPDAKDGKEPFPKARIHPDLAKPKPVNHVVTMPRCRFAPRVIAARHGDTLEYRNDAAIPHNVRYDTFADSLFNVLVPAGKKYVPEKPLAASFAPAYVSDAIHPWMRGYVRVFDHPYFAVTDADGKYEMKLVPKGDWRIVYWHETGFHTGADGRFGFPLKVSGGTPTVEVKDVAVELPETR